MRVTFVAPFGTRHKTTVWARTTPLARELIALGHEATILVPPWDSPEDSGRTLTLDGVELVHVEVTRGVASAVYALGRALDRLNPDVVHIVKPRAHAGLVQFVRWVSSALHPAQRLVLDIDDWEQAWAEVNPYGPLMTRALAWQEEWGIRHAHAITAASRWLEERAAAYAPVTPRLYLPNGVTLPIEPPRSIGASDPPTVLYFTRYVEVPPKWLADFAANLWAMTPDARLVIAGAPLQAGADLTFRNTMTMRNPRAGERVVWLGQVAAATLPALYAASAVAIFPALPVPLQLAKCSVRLANTLLEGVPVVASDVGEQGNYGANGSAILVPADGSLAEFAQRTAQLLGDPKLRRETVQRARAHLAEHYQWQSLGVRLSNFYSSVLG
jgi:glycosyltransferase involved in cell wall biosynthesis